MKIVAVDVFEKTYHVEPGPFAMSGGRVVSDANAPEWWTLADPEGNEVDLAIWG